MVIFTFRGFAVVTGADCADRLMFTEVRVYNNNGYKLCGNITEELLQVNKLIVDVNCSTPLVGSRVRLQKYANHVHSGVTKKLTFLNICEVFVIGYVYVG